MNSDDQKELEEILVTILEKTKILLPRIRAADKEEIETIESEAGRGLEIIQEQ